jgi:hypothetical protein
MNIKIIVLIVAIVLIFAFFLKSGKEAYTQELNQIVPKDGFYMINFKNGLPLNASAFTTVGCQEFSLGKPVPREQKGWILQKVVGSEGVYLIKKATADECLHAGLDNQLMTYFYPGCNRKSLCGEPETNYKNELDPYSTRSYWRIFITSDNSVVIQNVETKGFISFVNNRVKLVKSPMSTSKMVMKNTM